MRYSILVLIALGAGAVAADGPILGYDEASSAAQREAEALLDASIDANEMDAWLKHLSARPHHVGSPKSRENAEYIAELLDSWGYDTEIAEYRILLPTPRVREVELLSPTQYTATLREDSLEEDPSTFVRDELLAPYNAFSIDGEAEGELVFVNYGIPEDYEVLEQYGIDVRGKIAIAKYGRSWRGIKPKLAGEKGAIATIIYSDPIDDGYGAGDTYPDGPFKHESGVQRGSVMDMPTYPGDVLTPGRGATQNARRLNRNDAPTITRIPVLPISHRDALPLLAALGGEVVPPEWRGGLPITYHFGPGPARVRMRAQFDWNMVTAYNVIARLRGSEYPDEWVIRGNHHDGWNHGAADPISGMVATLAEAKAVAMLAREGRRPKRTMIYAAWDAEEPGLIGSTEWAEHHAADLKEHAVAYINTDGSDRGFINIGGSHVLERFFNQVIEEVDDPRSDITLKERRRAYELVYGDDKAKQTAEERNDLRIYPMGSGSDYTPFLQHLGIASAHVNFSGEADDGSYHTLYDTYEHYTTFQDPGLAYGATLARVTGRMALRLANAPRLPFEFLGLADNIALYVSELEELAETMRAETGKTNKLIDDGTYAAAINPYKSISVPVKKAAVPYFNFAPLKNAVDRLQQAAERYDRASAGKAEVSPRINKLLFTSERLLTRDAGLEGRPWYKHHIYAPGFYTGYGVKTLPGVREAIEEREYDKVASQIAIAASVLNNMAARIEDLSERIGGD
ncbi:MAG: transferrin receptor-like dimerization domain-containing protein [Woeseiaceae bacterium]|nr:transferrin receptor-like dimerization domain-containing protein [Woeseiaceae bacterium]